MAKKHTEAFRQEAVRIALTSGLSRKQVAEDLGVGFSTLAKWIQRSRSMDELPPQSDIDLAKEVASNQSKSTQAHRGRTASLKASMAASATNA